jgi:hypothetical protein
MLYFDAGQGLENLSIGESAAMHGPMRGELNSPDAGFAQMLRIRQVRKPQKGCLGWCALRCVSGEAERRPIDTLRRRRVWRVVARPAKRVRGGPEKSGSRFPWQALEGQTPWEAPAVAGLIPRVVARHSREARAQEPRSVGPVRSLRAAEILPDSTVGGFLPAERPARPLGRGNLRRVNPRSAAGVKQNRHGIRGSKPSRG